MVMRKSKKVCLLGDGAVGKTSLIRRYVLDSFDDKYITTIGTKVSKKVLKYPHTPEHEETELSLMIWDIIGQRGLPQLHSMYFKGASAGFMVCDLTRRSTLQALDSWRNDFFGTVGKVPLIILVNKADLKAQAQMSQADIEKVAKSMGAKYFLTSAKSGMNVQKAFYALGKVQIIKGGTFAAPKKKEADISFARQKAKPNGAAKKQAAEEQARKERMMAKKKEMIKRKKIEEARANKAAMAKHAEGAKPKKKKKAPPEGAKTDPVRKKKKKKSGDVEDMDFGDLDDVESWG